ncbi:MAG: biosynthetic peptidoglycan transglycosylase, partial [Aestuariivirga sp.]
AYSDLNSIEQNVFGSGWSEEVSTLEKAVILLEDRRYYTHRGIDVRSIIRELVKTLTFRRHGGASTIEMQFVRTCTGYKEIFLRRKAYEMFLAWALLHRANKLEILRSHLSIAYFGTGLQGSTAASIEIFNKEPNQLSERECYELASMLVYPRPREPNEFWQQKVERRATYGQKLLAKVGDRYLK